MSDSVPSNLLTKPMDSPLLENIDNSTTYVEEKKTLNSVVKKFGFESKKLWKIAGPAILTSICLLKILLLLASPLESWYSNFVFLNSIVFEIMS